MKFHRRLQVGDRVGLLNLHEAYPKMGVVRAIDGNVVAVHKTAGALPFHNMQIEHQTVMVHKSAVFDAQSWLGWLRALWVSL
jgi:hypothetical protein